jgi:Glycoside hydrolase family 44
MANGLIPYPQACSERLIWRRTSVFGGLLVLLTVISSLVFPNPTEAASTSAVYSKGFLNGWKNGGPGAGNYTSGNGRPIELDFGNYNYAKLSHSPIPSQQVLRFSLRVPSGLSPADQNWYVELAHDAHPSRRDRGRFPLDFAKATRDATGAYRFEVNVTSGNLAGDPVDSILFQAGSAAGPGLPSGTIGYLDEIEFTGAAVAAAPFARIGAALNPRKASTVLAVDCRAKRRSISPEIYGIAMYSSVFQPKAPELTSIGSPARRWGGNRTSRYNAAVPGANTANDYFFQNTPEPITVDDFVEHSAGARQVNAITIPTLGWIAKDTSSYSYPETSFGPGQSPAGRDPARPERTNGLVAGSSPPQIVATTPETTSIRNSPDTAARFVDRVSKVARNSGGSINSYIIDNEPDLWHETHRDVRRVGFEPNYLTYQELVEMTRSYVAAIRSADPNAKIAGPAISGYNFLLYSPRDVATGSSTDFQANGSVELLKWYLQQMKATPGRTIDVVDVHHYPAAQDGIGRLYPDGKLDLKTFNARINTVRGLYDPTYADDNYIGKGQVGTQYARPQLIPRIKGWIKDVYGSSEALGISIGEWNFGQEDHMSGAIATAEALGVFGREHLDSAYYWTVPPEKSPSYWAFRAFTNVDGRGGRFGKYEVPTLPSPPLVLGSASRNAVSVFASSTAASGDGDVTAVLINKSADTAFSAKVRFDGCLTAKVAQTFTYDGSSSAGYAAQNLKSDRSELSLSLKPWSITVVKVGRS